MRTNSIPNKLLLENIEALAENEDRVPELLCYGKGSIDCPKNKNKANLIYNPFSL